ncbi:Polar amino acid ABC-type transport system, permease protein II [Pseudomonas syringae pv. aptata]|uniref:Arginine ABC transporter permease protein ArtM n=1 Tax=Pseudomonas syringae pv. aptata TaxID=83167 RepID=A0A3M5WZQ7_PSEAP|nr:Polar amino acid ABC-type transport system, permease protein II [Pseudomonas syringae pv. aptata]
MNWEVIIKWLPRLAQGATLTLELVAIAVIAGLILAIPMGIARASRHWPVRALPYAYIFFFRGTPLLVQLFLVYYGLAQFESVRQSALWPYLRDPFWCAVVTMTLHTAAYIAEILRGAMQAVDRQVKSKRHGRWACRNGKRFSTSSCHAQHASACRPTATK